MSSSKNVAVFETSSPELFGMTVEAHLQAIDMEMPGSEFWQHRYFAAAERIYLPLWQAMGPIYLHALTAPTAEETQIPEVQIVRWPGSIEDHQSALNQLLNASHLRRPWRDFSEHYDADPKNSSDLVALEHNLRISAAALREIPIYQGDMRVSCQQMVCMPDSVWQAIHKLDATYLPAPIDCAVVDDLAQRVARIFNVPIGKSFTELISRELSDTVVWNTSPAGLTSPINSHGIRDRWESEWHCSAKQPEISELVAQHWRYEGFYGELEVVHSSGEPWRVAILAPLHFVRRLAMSNQL